MTEAEAGRPGDQTGRRPTPEEDRRARDAETQAAEGDYQETRRLRASYYIEQTANAISELEPGAEFTSSALTRALLIDTDAVIGLRNQERANYYAPPEIASLYEQSRAEIGAIMEKGPANFAGGIVEEKERLKSLVDRLTLAEIDWSEARGARSDVSEADAQKVHHNLRSLRAAVREQEDVVAGLEQKLILVCENETTLAQENQVEVRDRLTRKEAQARQFAMAALSVSELIERKNAFVETISDIGMIGKLALDVRTPITATHMDALFNLPGIREGINTGFRITLQLDRGEGLQEDSPLPGFRRNLCAVSNITPDFKDGFNAALAKKIQADCGGSQFLAENAVGIVNSFREITFLNAFYDNPKDKNFQVIEAEDGTSGSAFAIAPPDTIKIFDIKGKFKSEASKGYPSPLNLVIAETAERAALPLLFYMKHGGKRAFDVLLTGETQLSDIPGAQPENFFFLQNLKIFQACKLYDQLSNMPREQIELLLGRTSTAFKAIRVWSDWAADTLKRAEKSYALSFEDPKDPENRRGKAEAMRVLANCLGAFMRKAALRNYWRGGDTYNAFEVDWLKQALTRIKEYTQEKVCHEDGVMTRPVVELVCQMIWDQRRGGGEITTAEDLLVITSADLDKNPWLVDLLAKRVGDDAELYERGQVLEGKGEMGIRDQQTRNKKLENYRKKVNESAQGYPRA